MSRTVRTLVIVAAVLALVVAGVLTVRSVREGAGSAQPDVSAGSPAAAPAPVSRPSPDELGRTFLDEYVEDGRVVRLDQGGDTVSEGQAYGMLVAVGIRDEQSFDEIWSWTTANLLREDGLLAWQWDEGGVVDDEPASDADLDAARALVLAGEQFDRPDLTAAGTALSTRILDRLTVVTPVGRILLPGLWAATEPWAYNPSYASPAAFAVLGEATGDARWAELSAGSAQATTALLDATDLPPDWAQIASDGQVDPTAGAASTGTDVRYSYDAARLPLRYAESCDPTDAALAARLTETLSRSDALAAELDLGGGSLGQAQSPLAYAARAAASAAGGDDTAASLDLDRMAALSVGTPTYYGSAWAALAALMLETDRLGGCPTVTED